MQVKNRLLECLRVELSKDRADPRAQATDVLLQPSRSAARDTQFTPTSRRSPSLDSTLMSWTLIVKFLTRIF